MHTLLPATEMLAKWQWFSACFGCWLFWFFFLCFFFFFLSCLAASSLSPARMWTEHRRYSRDAAASAGAGAVRVGQSVYRLCARAQRCDASWHRFIRRAHLDDRSSLISTCTMLCKTSTSTTIVRFACTTTKICLIYLPFNTRARRRSSNSSNVRRCIVRRISHVIRSRARTRNVRPGGHMWPRTRVQRIDNVCRRWRFDILRRLHE